MSPTKPAITPDTIFISYSRKDWDEFVRPLVERLEGAGLKVWVDQHLLEGGQDWLDEIEKALDSCGCMILCVSPDALESDWVKMEYRTFIMERKLIIPLMCLQSKLPPSLHGIQVHPYKRLDALVSLLQGWNSTDLQTVKKPKSAPRTPKKNRVISARNARSVRQLAVLKGHTDTVNAIAFSPDGKFLASASNDRTIILWDVTLQQAIETLTEEDMGSVRTLVFSPDGKLLVTGSDGGDISLWDMETRKRISRVRTELMSAPSSLAFSPSSQVLAVAWGAGDVRFWENPLDSKFNFWSRSYIGLEYVLVVSYASDEHLFAVGHTSGEVGIVTRGEVRKLTGHNEDVTSLAFTRNSRYVASASYDRTARLWNVETQSQMTLFNGNDMRVHSIAFSSDESILAGGAARIDGMQGAIFLWDATTGAAIQVIKRDTGVLSVAFSPDGTLLAFTGTDGQVRLWGVRG